MVDIAIMRRLWLIPQCHGLYSPLIKKSFKAITPEFLKDQMEYLKAHEDRIWIGRFIDVYKYLLEKKETQLDIQRPDENTIIFSLNNNLDRSIYSYPLTIIISKEAHPSQKVKAFDLAKKKSIPLKIVGDKIYLDVIPSGQKIKVEWK